MATHYSDEICKCGCGEPLGEISRATYFRMKGGYANAGWKSGHSFRGERNPRWTGHKTLSSQGYKMIWEPNHPNARKAGWLLEHRQIMSEKLNRSLCDDEIVHHINGNKLDNRPENLELMSASSHYFQHDPNQFQRIARVPKQCITCGKFYVKKIISNHKRAKFCSTKCRNAAGPQHPRRNK